MTVLHLKLPRRNPAPGCSSCGGLVISDGPHRTGTDRCCLLHWARLCADCLLRTHPQGGAAVRRSRVSPLTVACPKCGAPPGAPCADLRSWDRNLYGSRAHVERLAARPQPVDNPCGETSNR